MKVHTLYVRMADNEWGTTHPMEKIAAEQFRLNRHVENLVVNVQEHAGWYLQYAIVDGRQVIVGTANDAAVVTPERKRFWDSVKGAEHTMLRQINRNDLSDEQRARAFDIYIGWQSKQWALVTGEAVWVNEQGEHIPVVSVSLDHNYRPPWVDQVTDAVRVTGLVDCIKSIPRDFFSGMTPRKAMENIGNPHFDT